MKCFTWSSIAALGLAVGCGGGGGGATAGIPSPTPTPSLVPQGSARFTVDAVSGAVTVEPLTGSRAAFGGNSLSFSSTQLLSEGSPERRVLRVTAKNNTAETIGVSGQFRVHFSSFQNQNTPVTDLRSTIKGETVWGTGSTPSSSGPMLTSNLQGPTSVFFDEANGTLYCCDPVSGRVLKASQGTASFINLSVGTVEEAVAGPGFIIVAEDLRLRIIDNEVTLSNLVGGASGSTDGAFSAALFTNINDVFLVSATGPTNFELLVADHTNVRRVIRNPANPNGLVTTLFTSGSLVRGVTQKDGVIYHTSGSSIQARSGADFAQLGFLATSGHVDGPGTSARFNTPNAIRWVGNSLFIADTGNNRIRQMNLRPGGKPTNASSWWVSTLSGSSTAASTDGIGTVVNHNAPTSLAKGPGESLFVADQAGNKIRRISPMTGQFVSGFGDSTTNPTELAQLANPSGFAPSLPVRDPYIIESKSFGPGASLQLSDWQFTLPEGLRSFSFIVTVEAETEAAGVLPSVSNTTSGTAGSPLVRVRGFAGTSAQGYLDGPIAASAFAGPGDLCMDQNGAIFVADTLNHALRRISREGQVTTIAGGDPAPGTVDGAAGVSRLTSPVSVACSPDGAEVYFASTTNVRVAVLTSGANPADRSSWTIFTLAGSTIAGNLDGLGSAARFNGMSDLIYVSPTTLVAADTNNHRLRSIIKIGPSFALASYRVRHLSGSATGVSGYADNQLTPTSVLFHQPKGLALLPNGSLVVSDSQNARLRLVTTGGGATTLSGSGTIGYLDSSSPLGANMMAPRALAAGPSGYVYLADFGNAMIRRISPSGAVSTVAGVLQALGSDDGTGATSSFGGLEGMCTSPSGDLYVIDRNRIRLIQRMITN